MGNRIPLKKAAGIKSDLLTSHIESRIHLKKAVSLNTHITQRQQSSFKESSQSKHSLHR